VEALAGGARTGYGQPDGDGEHSSRGGADQDEAALQRRAARPSLRLDVGSQTGGRLDGGGGAPRQCDRPLLLGEPVGELRRGGDPCLERGATLRRERAVCERRQLGVLLTSWLVFSASSHRHDSSNATAASRRPAGPIGPRPAASSRVGA
jgi:hypothetical protein